MKLYLYNWGVTKISQILRLGQKTVGFLTLLGLFSMYIPPRLLQSLPSILRPLINLSQSIKPLVIGAQISGAAIITGYYILLKSGFNKDEIKNFFDNMFTKTSSMYESVRNRASGIYESMKGRILTFIDSTKKLLERNINNRLDEYAFSYEPSPPELPSALSPIIIPSLSQDLYEKLKNVNNDLDDILNELNGQIDKTTEDYITQQISNLETSQPQNHFTPTTVNLTQYNNSQEGEEESKSFIGGRRRHKRKTYRRRSTKRRQSSLHKKRRHTNRRRSRRSRRYHRR
jgi:hypothetical protein